MSLFTAGWGAGTDEFACAAAAVAASAAAFFATKEFHGRKALFWMIREDNEEGNEDGSDVSVAAAIDAVTAVALEAAEGMDVGAGALAYDDDAML